MLQLLRIRNLAIIEELELELGPGLNVVSGETGAGKSILIAALKLVLGEPGGAGLVRTGAQKAEVEALFDLSDDPNARDRLAAEGIPCDADELVVRRVVHASGRTRAYLGGSLATAGQLARLAAGLVDISSQHQHQTLTDSTCHLTYLDAFAELHPQREAVAQAFGALLRCRKALEEAESAVRERAQREDLLKLQLDEIERLDPKAGEIDELSSEIERLRHADRLVRVANTAQLALYTADRSLCGQLAALLRPVTDAGRLDPALGRLSERLDSARLELEEAARDLSIYAADLDLDPARFQAMEDRHQALRRLCRKHGCDLEGVLAFRAAAAEELLALGDAEGRVLEREQEHDKAQAAARVVADRLSAARKAAATRLGDAITAELASLGMGGARVLVEVAPLGAEGELALDGARLTATGIDRVEFLIAPNPGESPRPLAQVASGGELSRSLLALKRVLAGVGPVGTYVFDEVDTGVGGAVAEVIGQKLAQVARHHQVLSISHQPQVCVYADHHFHVRKVVKAGRTFSKVGLLDENGRQVEIARMLGGIEVGEAARDAARALLAGAGR